MPDSAVGLYEEKGGSWKPKTYKITKDQWEISRFVSERGENQDRYVVTRNRGTYIYYYCRLMEGKVHPKKSIRCSGSGSFKMDVATGKYISSFTEGYWNGSKREPSIEIGFCKKGDFEHE
jgi:hypothetical protein